MCKFICVTLEYWHHFVLIPFQHLKIWKIWHITETHKLNESTPLKTNLHNPLWSAYECALFHYVQKAAMLLHICMQLLITHLAEREKRVAIAHTDKFQLLIDVSWKQVSAPFRDARIRIFYASLRTAANRERIAITNFETQRCNLSLVFAEYQQQPGRRYRNWNWQLYSTVLFAYPRQINMQK